MSNGDATVDDVARRTRNTPDTVTAPPAASATLPSWATTTPWLATWAPTKAT